MAARRSDERERFANSAHSLASMLTLSIAGEDLSHQQMAIFISDS